MPWGSWITCEETINGPDVGPDFTGLPNASLQQAPRLHLRGPRRRPVQPPADHGRRSLRPRGGRLGRTAAEPCTSPRTTSATRRASTGTCRRTIRWPTARWPTVASCRCSPSMASPTPIWPPPSRRAPSTGCAGSTSTIRRRCSRPAPPNNDALQYVGLQGFAAGCGAVLATRGRRRRRQRRSTSPRRRAAARRSRASATRCRAGATASVRSGRTTPGPSASTSSTSRLVQDTLDFPDNVTTRGRNTLVLCEDSTSDNFLRTLTSSGKLGDLALNRLVSQIGARLPRFNDEFAGATFSPNGETLFVNIQASRGMTFAIWGPWAKNGV